MLMGGGSPWLMVVVEKKKGGLVEDVVDTYRYVMCLLFLCYRAFRRSCFHAA